MQTEPGPDSALSLVTEPCQWVVRTVQFSVGCWGPRGGTANLGRAQKASWRLPRGLNH